MKKRVTSFLVFSLIFSGFASPCSCMDCSCEGEEAAQIDESHSCCQAVEAEAASCCHHTAKHESRSCCGKEHCECGHSEMGCDCGEKSTEPEPTAPQPTNETSSKIQILASMPMTLSVDLESCLSRTAFGIKRRAAFYSNTPIYLSTHSILC